MRLSQDAGDDRKQLFAGGINKASFVRSFQQSLCNHKAVVSKQPSVT